ncbi:putative nuclease HARBI1 [Spodoptera frugiperda]|uniref:Nuclease HARBI1 n=1 Tax=Spodoptera frugiperda TaxID=7108 RepID=A0A9R0F2C7_SPOFR|nr:putative nuclease HARBI1 [Spodoptera frugiperda]XP_050555067.1 putative nuclease HARBI1 [Spodoptera frugiperda]XP_050557289.1 putative nuclease HARBI1 [Spodoptera frugiperda]XP_050559290.1 putative nuclease HARBI1 [Spodoptera frugiperda]
MDIFDDDNELRTYRDEIEEIRNFRNIGSRRRVKIYNSRSNPMEELSESDFKHRYRFSKENMVKIINILRNDLSMDSRGGSIPVELQVMAAIRYWGRHEIQEDCAEIHGMSQQTLSRTAKRVAIALASKSSIYIKMPSNLREETETIRKFETICGFPHITGAIDCTHIKIRKVGGDVGQYYINRKGHYSINTQMVCNADLKICDIVCHWRGSTHDARIWRESSIKRRFEEREFKGKLIGDGGYPCTPYLLTPVLRPRNEAERRYNYSHIRTRNVIERCFGVLKARFRILLEIMRGSFNTIKTTIVACAVLHNLAIEFDDTLSYETPYTDSDEDTEAIEQDSNNLTHITRNIFIENFF